MKSIKRILLALGTSLLAGCLAQTTETSYDTLRNPDQPKHKLETIMESDFNDNNESNISYTHRAPNNSQDIAFSSYNSKQEIDDTITTDGYSVAADFSWLVGNISTLAFGIKPAIQVENKNTEYTTTYTTPEDYTVNHTETSEIKDGIHLAADLKLEWGEVKAKKRQFSFLARPFFYDKQKNTSVLSTITHPNPSYPPITISIEDTLQNQGSGGQAEFSAYLNDENKLKTRLMYVRYESDKQEELLAGVSLIGSDETEDLSYFVGAFYTKPEEKHSYLLNGGFMYNLSKFGYGLSAVCDSSQLWNCLVALTYKPASLSSFDKNINNALATGFEQEYLERGIPKQLELAKAKTIRDLERNLGKGVYLIIGPKQKSNKEWEVNSRLGILFGNKYPTIGFTYGPFLERSLPHIKNQFTIDTSYTWGPNTAGVYFTHKETTTGPIDTLGGRYKITF